MTVAFLVFRKGYLKVMGALIQAAVDQGHDVVLLWDPVEAKQGEQVAREDLAAWPAARVLTCARRAPLLPVLRAAGAQALVGPRLHSILRDFGLDQEIDAIRAVGVKLYSVDYGLDTLISDPAGYRVIDKTFYGSEWQRQQHWKIQAAEFAKVGDPAFWASRSAVCGSTMLDQLAVVDRGAVRKRYGIPDNRPVVLFMTLKLDVPDLWRQLVWGGQPRGWRAARALWKRRTEWLPAIVRSHGYRDLLLAVRRFSDRVSATLVVKSREKNGDPRFVSSLADVFLLDERVYPYTSIELMAIADLCVHFQSAAVLEAAFAGVGSLSVVVSQTHLQKYPTFDEFYGARSGSLQNFPGVVWSLSHAEIAERLEAATLADFRVDAGARRRYVTQFVGFDDTCSSERALAVMDAASRAPR